MDLLEVMINCFWYAISGDGERVLVHSDNHNYNSNNDNNNNHDNSNLNNNNIDRNLHNLHNNNLDENNSFHNSNLDNNNKNVVSNIDGNNNFNNKNVNNDNNANCNLHNNNIDKGKLNDENSPYNISLRNLDNLLLNDHNHESNLHDNNCPYNAGPRNVNSRRNDNNHDNNNNHSSNHHCRHRNSHKNRIDKNRGKKPEVKVTGAKHQSTCTIRNIDGSTTNINIAMSSSSSRTTWRVSSSSSSSRRHHHRPARGDSHQQGQTANLANSNNAEHLVDIEMDYETPIDRVDVEQQRIQCKQLERKQRNAPNGQKCQRPRGTLCGQDLGLEGSYPKSKRKRSEDRGDEAAGPSGTRRRKTDHPSISEEVEGGSGNGDDSSAPKLTGSSGTASGLPARDYMNHTNKMPGTYKDDSTAQLYLDFHTLSRKSVRASLKLFEYHYAPTFDVLTKAMKQMEQEGKRVITFQRVKLWLAITPRELKQPKHKQPLDPEFEREWKSIKAKIALLRPLQHHDDLAPRRMFPVFTKPAPSVFGYR
ncbi:hypothetical protein BG004_008084 [Podila humilis]|nr:hypothetical protein BG004_008084 [Podila humilis]